MRLHPSRRQFLTSATVVGATASLPAAAQPPTTDYSRWRYCLNTSTISGQKLSIEEQVRLAGRAGYDGIELWVRDIEEFVERGGKPKDLKKQIADTGLKVEGAIGFAHWIVDDPGRRKAGLEQARHDMDLVQQIGGTRIAAPPAGATKSEPMPLREISQRYHALLEVGTAIGVIPQLEVWGFSNNLSRLGEVAQVSIEAAHSNACLLLDIYHLYRGGSEFIGLQQIAGQSMHAIHINDYPAGPERLKLSDKDRIYPGDGVAPLDNIFQVLARNGFAGALSLELFNREYWQQPASQVAQKGLQKMKSAVEKAFS